LCATSSGQPPRFTHLPYLNHLLPYEPGDSDFRDNVKILTAPTILWTFRLPDTATVAQPTTVSPTSFLSTITTTTSSISFQPIPIQPPTPYATLISATGTLWSQSSISARTRL